MNCEYICAKRENMHITPIAHFRSAFPAKFGIPRQSGIVKGLRGTIVFEPQYRNDDALRGLEEFDYLWIMWGFSANREMQREWSPTVRPPLLGGNKRIGVFATRSPYRPNALGLSSVKIERIAKDKEHGLVIEVLGADIMDGTPIYDIKPYLAYCDAHPDARSGFVDEHRWEELEVIFPDDLKALVPDEDIAPLIDVLRIDPRPQYHCDEEKCYGMPYKNMNIHFKVNKNVLTVINITTQKEV